MQKGISLIKRKIKPWIKQKGVLDVIIFGSTRRGKERPKDLDLCILIKDEDEKKSLDLIGSLGILTDKFNLKTQINILTSSSFIKGNTLTKTLLLEGYSIKQNKKVSSIFGFKSESIFIYTLKHFSPSKRVQFHYVLRGRYGSKGVLREINSTSLGNGVIRTPSEREDTLKEVFDRWGVNYIIERGLVNTTN